MKLKTIEMKRKYSVQDPISKRWAEGEFEDARYAARDALIWSNSVGSCVVNVYIPSCKECVKVNITISDSGTITARLKVET
jgi:hypothetical protein